MPEPREGPAGLGGPQGVTLGTGSWAGNTRPWSTFFRPPQPHPTPARESWLLTPQFGLCGSGGLGRPEPGQFLKRLVVGLVGSPAQVTGARSRRRSDQQPGPPPLPMRALTFPGRLQNI